MKPSKDNKEDVKKIEVKNEEKKVQVDIPKEISKEQKK